MFIRNVGILDRIARVTLGLVFMLVGLILIAVLQGKVPGLVVASIGGLGLITGITGVCPLYTPFGINTREKEKELFERYGVKSAGLMDNCMSIMGSLRQIPAERASSIAEQTCGSCPPSIGRTPDPKG